jgi:hypothetical protein
MLEKEFTPISREIRPPCTYCGQGFYELKAQDNADVHNFGYQVVGNPKWRILVCNMCGHVQAFRIEAIQQKDWWK